MGGERAHRAVETATMPGGKRKRRGLSTPCRQTEPHSRPAKFCLIEQELSALLGPLRASQVGSVPSLSHHEGPAPDSMRSGQDHAAAASRSAATTVPRPGGNRRLPRPQRLEEGAPPRRSAGGSIPATRAAPERQGRKRAPRKCTPRLDRELRRRATLVRPDRRLGRRCPERRARRARKSAASRKRDQRNAGPARGFDATLRRPQNEARDDPVCGSGSSCGRGSGSRREGSGKGRSPRCPMGSC